MKFWCVSICGNACRRVQSLDICPPSLPYHCWGSALTSRKWKGTRWEWACKTSPILTHIASPWLFLHFWICCKVPNFHFEYFAGNKQVHIPTETQYVSILWRWNSKCYISNFCCLLKFCFDFSFSCPSVNSFAACSTWQHRLRIVLSGYTQVSGDFP